MYWTLTYGSTIHYNPITLRPEMKDYTVLIDGISKMFAATGVRVGWALGPSFIITKMKALLSHVGAWAPMAEQKAVAKYLPQTESINNYMLHFKNALQQRLQKIYDGFMSLRAKGYCIDAIAPQAAIYLTVKLDLTGKKSANKNLQTQADVTDYIL